MDRRLDSRSRAFGARGCSALLGCVGVALTLGATAPSAPSVLSFAGPRHYSTGSSPVAVASGDLNGDGARDVATANEDGHGVSVLLNKGDGSFRARRNYATAKTPESVVIGDLNGDGKPDLATANRMAGTVSVLLNRGDGSFRARHDYRAGGRPRSVAIGDLNGDGKPDLATSNIKHTSATRTRGTVSVFLARGDRSFAPRHDYRTAKNPVSLALGDLNGDATPDLVTASVAPSRVSPRLRRGTISVRLNRGGGSFGARRDYGVGVSRTIQSAQAQSVTIGDLNGDGKLDVAAASMQHGRNSVLVFLNRGRGRLRADRGYLSEHGAYSVATGDPNGDRKLDLLVATGVSVFVLVNRGNGSFWAGVDHPTDRDPYSGEAGSSVSVSIGDLNGDGRPDLVTANSWGDNVSVLLNRPGLCAVQFVADETLPEARRAIARAGCRIGKITSVAYRAYPGKGRVVWQKPKFGAVLPIGSRVNLFVSRGPKR